MNMDQIKIFLQDFKNRDNSNAKIGEIKADLKDIKAKYVSNKNEEGAKAVWCLEQVLKIQTLYLTAYGLMKIEKFYEAWQELEQCEISIESLKRHFSIDEDYYLSFINKHVKQYQSLYPYKWFGSPEILIHEQKCNICGKVVSIRNPCGHEIGEIYNGEMCLRAITEMEFIGWALVNSPVNKYSVAFMQDEKIREPLDYNYSHLSGLIQNLQSPFDHWEFRLTKKMQPHSKFPNLSRNDSCPCGSGKKYKKCCLMQPGILMPHYKFTISNPIVKSDSSLDHFLSQVTKDNLHDEVDTGVAVGGEL